MTKKILTFLFLFFLLTPFALAQSPQEETLEGQVIKVLEEKEEEHYQRLEIFITKGSLKDEKIILETQGKVSTVAQSQYKKGDEVLLTYTQDS